MHSAEVDSDEKQSPISTNARCIHAKLGIFVALLILLETCVGSAGPVTPGSVFGWGFNNYQQTTIPASATNVIAIACGESHSMALRLDGSIVCWGYNYFGQVTGILPGTSIPPHIALGSPPNMTNIAMISASGYNSAALRNDGTVAVWGDTNYLQTIVPTGLSNVVAISVGGGFVIALKQDGRVTGWGQNDNGQCNFPANLNNAIAVAAGGAHTLVLKSDTTVAAFGANGQGERNVPSGLSNVVAIAAGGNFSLALRSDGTVITWGETSPPAGLTNVMAIAAGSSFCLVLKSNGTVVGWGNDSYGQSTIPSGVNGVIAVVAGSKHSLSILANPVIAAPALLNLGLYPGLAVTGTTGATYRIEYTTDVATNALWNPLTNITLFTVPQYLFDWSAAGQPRRFYRAVSP